jgi:Tfp pilus assembly protein PilV
MEFPRYSVLGFRDLPSHFMAIKNKQQGFTLLIATIFMSVMLLFGLALASLAYKQQVLATSAVQSQYAFYAADAALECTLYADQQQNLFAYTSNMAAPAPIMSCDNAAPVSATVVSHTATRWAIATRLSLDSNKRCADVTIYKPDQNTAGTVYLFSQGYDVSCATVSNPSGARFVSRGLNAKYGSAAPVAPLTCGTGGAVTESNGYCIHTFTSSGSLALSSSVTAEILVVAGGGGGARPSSDGGGGGGGGGVIYHSAKSLVSGTYPVTVGAGGAAQTSSGGKGNTGGDSSFGSTIAKGGGGGGSYTGGAGNAGGSGGGGGGSFFGAPYTSAGGTNSGTLDGGTAYVHNGGNGNTTGGGGGGGGAGVVGSSAVSGAGANGGNGIALLGATYAGGGGGGSYSSANQGGTGGTGGGGNGLGGAGTANTGGGGGGGGGMSGYVGAAGGSGIVIVRYLKP